MHFGGLDIKLEDVEGVEGREMLDVEELATCWGESNIGQE